MAELKAFNGSYEDLQAENQVMYTALNEILRYLPKYAYASGSSHPDTNNAWVHYWAAERALSRIDELRHRSAVSSEW